MSIRTLDWEDRIHGCNPVIILLRTRLALHYCYEFACKLGRKFDRERYQELGVVTGYGEN